MSVKEVVGSCTQSDKPVLYVNKQTKSVRGCNHFVYFGGFFIFDIFPNFKKVIYFLFFD